MPEPFRSDDARVAHQHFLPLVKKLKDDDVELFRGDAVILHKNVSRGVEAIAPHEARLRTALPLLSLYQVWELPALALALVYADKLVFAPSSPGEIKQRQARLRPWRRRMLAQLGLLAELGLVPEDRVQSIREGRGSLDEATDGVAIAGVFQDLKTQLAGKHPFTESQLAQLAEDGNWLIASLTPKGAQPKRGERSPEALLRDRFYSEIVRRYDDLYKAGVEIWGRRGVDQHLPALGSRLVEAAEELPPLGIAARPTAALEAAADAA